MSGSARRQPPHLHLVEGSGGHNDEERVLLLARSPRLERFAAASAAAGLELAKAIQLALAHALTLRDAGAFGLDADTARRLLNRAAAGARASRPLSDGDATYLRSLSRRAARTPADLPETLEIKLDERTAARVRDTVTETAIRAAVVEEMVSWEIAATLEGRTLGEWALHSLARERQAA